MMIMRLKYIIPAALLLFCTGTGLQTSQAQTKHPLPATPTPPAGIPKGDMVIWYRQPAKEWMEAMPVGNGRMGGMVFGGIRNERIALNESSFWSGRPHDYDDPGALSYFSPIRALVVAGKFPEAEKMADAHFFGIPAAQQAFEPLGDLLLSFDSGGSTYNAGSADNAGDAGNAGALDYRRELNMETGVVKVSYRVGDVRYTREVFISYPDRVMVVRITADKPGQVSVQAQLKSPYLDRTTGSPTRLIMDGSWKGPMKKDWLIAPVEGRGIGFRTVLLSRTEGGKSESTDSTVHIRGANAVTFIVTAATGYINYHRIDGNPADSCRRIVDAVSGKDYGTLLRRHEADLTGLMGRVHLDIGDVAMKEKPTDERLGRMREGSDDPNLEALIFQFGRYILASGSRAGGQPVNLQGIWNQDVIPPWGSKYTININTEMNYWPTEVCNLPECHQPLFDMLRDLSVTGAGTAKKYYGVGGWVAHHNTDLWRGTAPTDAARFGMWPVGGAWLCQDIWEHYAFTEDRSFLRSYYPVMKGAAQFLLELMVEDPVHHWLVTPFSMSPEHGYYDSAGRLSFLSPSPTMDIGIIRELFPHCIAAGKILGLDPEFCGRLQAALDRLPPYRIGSSGYLQEWIEDWKPAPAGHNVSPNFTFYPGSSIRLHRDTALAGAIERWMSAHPARGGFPASWDIAVWARLERGDKTAEGIRSYIGHSVADNLHNRGSNQSDASFGYTAAVAECLIQSHDGEISLLPALPDSWKEGEVQGLKARGVFEVSMRWKEGKLVSADIRGRGAASACRVRYGKQVVSFPIRAGQTVHLDQEMRVVQR